MLVDSSTHSPIGKRAATLARRCLSAGAVFSAGWVLAATAPFATSINLGLIQALDSVGKNLFGSAAFGVSAVPGNPVFPAGNVQIDLASDSRISTAIGVFIPGNPVVGNPCRRIAQLELRPPSVASDEPGLVLAYDPQYAPPLVVARTLGSSVPNVARCPSATTF